MGWDIRVWHEDLDDKARLIIEAGPEVPEEVVSTIAGAYWLEEIQQFAGDWDESDLEPPGGPMHG